MLSTLLPLAALLVSVTAKLDKPLINPRFNGLDGRLWDVLKPTPSTHDQWGPGWIPQACRDIAINEKLNPSDFEVFNIHYNDVCNPDHASKTSTYIHKV